jgi:hypothetical protein
MWHASLRKVAAGVLRCYIFFCLIPLSGRCFLVDLRPGPVYKKIFTFLYFLGWARLLVDRYQDLAEVPICPYPRESWWWPPQLRSPPTAKARSSTETTTTLATRTRTNTNPYDTKAIAAALTTPTRLVGDLCFDACFSQLEPKPPSGGEQTKILTPARLHSLR